MPSRSGIVASSYASSSSLDPAAVSNNVLYVDASDGSTITTSTGVTQWADKGPGGNHLTQPFGAGFEPAYETAAVNGLNAIHLDGSDDFLFSSDTDLHLSDGFSIFFVVQFDTVAKGGSSQNTLWSRDVRMEFTEYQGNTAGFINGANLGTGSVSLSSGVRYILEWHRDSSAAGNVTGKVNNVSNVSASATGTPSSADLAVGARPGGSSALFFDGYLCSIAAYNAKLGSTDRDGVYAHLASKWSV